MKTAMEGPSNTTARAVIGFSDRQALGERRSFKENNHFAVIGFPD
jgi:hypothetical protein